MNTRPQDYADDVRLIFDELTRINNLLRSDIRAIPSEDHWYSLPAPDFGHYVIGQKAGQRLIKLSEEARRRAKLISRIETDTIFNSLKRLLSERFILENRPIDIKQVDRVLSAAGKLASRACKNVKHLVPCHLMTARSPSSFSVGPVVFRNRISSGKYLLQKSRSHTFDEDPKKEKIF